MPDQRVERVEYVEQQKVLTVVFEDESRISYHNVGPTGAHAMMASDNLTHHYRKYIRNIFIEQKSVQEGHL